MEPTLKDIYDLLSLSLSAQQRAEWTIAPNEILAGERPIDLLKRGELKRLYQAVILL